MKEYSLIDKGGRPRKDAEAKKVIMEIVEKLKRCNIQQICSYYNQYYEEQLVSDRTIHTYTKKLAEEGLLDRDLIIDSKSKKLYLYKLPVSNIVFANKVK